MQKIPSKIRRLVLLLTVFVAVSSPNFGSDLKCLGLEILNAWERLHTLLPQNLKHFATDIDHLKFFTHTDVQDALSWMQNNNKMHLFDDYPDLTPGEITALNYYTTSHGNQINYWLRANRNNSAVLASANWSTLHGEKYLSFLEGAFSKLSHYSDSPILLRAEIRLFSDMNTWTTGTRLDYPGFISSAKDATGDFFDAGGFSHNVIFNINNNGNVKAINLEPFSQLETELEVLFLNGKKMELTAPPELRLYPDPNKVDEWSNNSFLSAELDQGGVPIPINPNHGTPDADKILTIDINLVD